MVWRLVAVYFLIQVGFYGLNMWLPTLLKILTQAGFGAVGLIATLPYLTAIGLMWLNGVLADRSARYARHVLIPMVRGICQPDLVGADRARGAVAVGAVHLPGDGRAHVRTTDRSGRPSSRTLPPVVVGGAMGLINALGNLGGYIGPYLGGYLQQVTGGFLAPRSCCLASLLAAGLVMMTVRIRSAPQPVTARDIFLKLHSGHPA